ncbi:MAG: hypothetical protein ACD_12C00293G0001 [uncultured bacterium]|nr:MAG: hypothetical protein ACD_12C00293G0001 [uncultured bacterium]
MKQVLNHLLITNLPKNIFYFSFDESVIKKDAEILRQILENYAISILSQPLNKTRKVKTKGLGYFREDFL